MPSPKPLQCPAAFQDSAPRPNVSRDLLPGEMDQGISPRPSTSAELSPAPPLPDANSFPVALPSPWSATFSPAGGAFLGASSMLPGVLCAARSLFGDGRRSEGSVEEA
ncbi:hypothetical protein Droror1_Dr00004613 [Drosera rotundifolia]